MRTWFLGAAAAILSLPLFSDISKSLLVPSAHSVPGTVLKPCQIHHLFLTIPLLLSLAFFPPGGKQGAEKLSSLSKLRRPGARGKTPTHALSLWKPSS